MIIIESTVDVKFVSLVEELDEDEELRGKHDEEEKEMKKKWKRPNPDFLVHSSLFPTLKKNRKKEKKKKKEKKRKKKKKREKEKNRKKEQKICREKREKEEKVRKA